MSLSCCTRPSLEPVFLVSLLASLTGNTAREAARPSAAASRNGAWYACREASGVSVEKAPAKAVAARLPVELQKFTEDTTTPLAAAGTRSPTRAVHVGVVMEPMKAWVQARPRKWLTLLVARIGIQSRDEAMPPIIMSGTRLPSLSLSVPQMNWKALAARCRMALYQPICSGVAPRVTAKTPVKGPPAPACAELRTDLA